MIGQFLLVHMIDCVGLLPRMDKLLDRSRELDSLVFLIGRADDAEVTILMRGELYGADCAVRAEVMRNRLVQHRVTDKEMPVRDPTYRAAP